MVDTLIQEGQHLEQKCIYISHCNCPERAEQVKNLLMKRCAFKSIKILDTAGISSMYANDGGIIIAILGKHFILWTGFMQKITPNRTHRLGVFFSL